MIMLSPRTFSANSGLSVSGLPEKGIYPSMASTARMGIPAVTVPSSGTCVKLPDCPVTRMERFSIGSRSM